MKKIEILIVLNCIMLAACEDSVGRRKLDLKSIENQEILVEKYEVSELTSIHQFVDMKYKRWNRVGRILEANDGSIDSVFIKHDTLFLQKTFKDPVIYDLAAIKFGYKIVVLDPKKD